MQRLINAKNMFDDYFIDHILVVGDHGGDAGFTHALGVFKCAEDGFCHFFAVVRINDISVFARDDVF